MVDLDSNYFRHLLSNENFKLLKYPYYQPPLLSFEKAEEFNIAVKLLSTDSNDFLLSKAQYLAIVEELYKTHYLEWFRYDDSYSEVIDDLLARINKEIPKNETSDGIALIQCHLFEEGQCPKFTVENVTIPRQRKSKSKSFLLVLIWILFSALTFILCLVPKFNQALTVLCSFLTIIPGLISLISFRRELFGAK